MTTHHGWSPGSKAFLAILAAAFLASGTPALAAQNEVRSEAELAFERAHGTIAETALKTGVSYRFLMVTAWHESSYDPERDNPFSTASGLFQFINSTWMDEVSEHKEVLAEMGVKGFGEHEWVPRSRQSRQQILQLRTEPEINAMVAALATARHEETIQDKIGRKATDADLFIAHFLGIDAGLRFLRKAERAPDAIAAYDYQSIARTNRKIFFTARKALTYKEVMRKIQGWYDRPSAQVLLGEERLASLMAADAPSTPEGAVPGGRMQVASLANPRTSQTRPEFEVVVPPRRAATTNIEEAIRDATFFALPDPLLPIVFDAAGVRVQTAEDPYVDRPPKSVE